MSTKYSVRYESDGQVTRIWFEMPESAMPMEIIRQAAGLLFLHDCCPGEYFGVYENDDREGLVTSTARVHSHYYDNDSLWALPEEEIQDL